MAWRRGYYDYDYFLEPSRPRAAKGGSKPNPNAAPLAKAGGPSAG